MIHLLAKLRHGFIKVHDGKLFPQYPYLFPVLAWPFYGAGGFFGLFVLNSIAFIGVVALCFGISKRLFQDQDLSLNACLILVLATFAWEYSQAAWPHALGLFFTMASFRLTVEAYYSDARRKRTVSALAAGLIAGLGPGVRLDGMMVIPCLVLPFLFARPWRPVEALLVIAGSIPGVGLLALTNLTKFGIFSPLSYGDGATAPSVPASGIILAASAVFFLAWVMTRYRFSGFFHRNRTKLFFTVAALVLITLLVAPQALEPVDQLMNNGYASLIDMRALSPVVHISGVIRTPSGALVSGGGIRKALVQSLPFIVLLIIPIIQVFRESKDRVSLLMLTPVPLVYISYYSYSFLDLMAGGLTLNARYYLPCLPFIAILCSYAVKELNGKAPCLDFTALAAICLVTTASYLILTNLLARNIDDLAFPLLVAPLLLAVSLLCLILATIFLDVKPVSWLKSITWAAITVAMVWSSLTALTQDYPIHRRWRATRYFYGQEALRHVPFEFNPLCRHNLFPCIHKCDREGPRANRPPGQL